MRFLRARAAVRPAFTTIVAEQPNLVVALPPEGGNIELEVRSIEGVIVNFATLEGETVPLMSGQVVTWSGNASQFAMLNFSVKKGATIAYWVMHTGPKRRYEELDPTPLSVSLQTSLEPSLLDVVNDAITAALQRMNRPDVSVRDVIEDLHDELDFPDEEPLPFENFGPGRMDPEPRAADIAGGDPKPPAKPASPKPAAKRKGTPQSESDDDGQLDIEDVPGREPPSTPT